MNDSRSTTCSFTSLYVRAQSVRRSGSGGGRTHWALQRELQETGTGSKIRFVVVSIVRSIKESRNGKGRPVDLIGHYEARI
jgi:hypothetical protein